MQMDHRLQPIAQPVGIHPRRILELEVWHGHIDRVLASAPELLPFDTARGLLRRLERDDAATVRRTGGQITLMLLGVSATAEGSEYAVLRNWQASAMNRIREAQA